MICLIALYIETGRQPGRGFKKALLRQSSKRDHEGHPSTTTAGIEVEWNFTHKDSIAMSTMIRSTIL